MSKQNIQPTRNYFALLLRMAAPLLRKRCDTLWSSDVECGYCVGAYSIIREYTDKISRSKGHAKV
ncbi:hypothetical protein [Lamprobacter modestohalophilus]|uniref:hypothetical protein n=1 Tax=Lamprobacter modestohalophilus TaxID=1064514 RepID=UPI00190346D1|nr:hypothetical protein [Lamprobacter modestohalophilus]